MFRVAKRKSPPLHRAASFPGEWIERRRGRKGESPPREKISSTRGNSAGIARKEWTFPFLLLFLFFAAFPSWVRYVGRAAKESLRASSTGIYIESSLSLLPSVAVLKRFTFAHLKAQAGSEFLGRRISNTANCARFTKNRLMTLTLTHNRARIYSCVSLFLYTFFTERSTLLL